MTKIFLSKFGVLKLGNRLRSGNKERSGLILSKKCSDEKGISIYAYESTYVDRMGSLQLHLKYGILGLAQKYYVLLYYTKCHIIRAVTFTIKSNTK